MTAAASLKRFPHQDGIMAEGDLPRQRSRGRRRRRCSRPSTPWPASRSRPSQRS